MDASQKAEVWEKHNYKIINSLSVEIIYVKLAIYFISILNGRVRRKTAIRPANHSDMNQTHCERFLCFDKYSDILI